MSRKQHLKKGTVYLVGAGPGDPDLITIKGSKVLELADVIVYDRLANPELLGFTRGKAPTSLRFRRSRLTRY
jgi:siroheme synthase